MYGRQAPGTIWQQFMDTALRDQPITTFGPFDPIGTSPYDDNQDDYDNQDDHDNRDSTHGDDNDRNDDHDDEAQNDLNPCDFVRCENGNPLPQTGWPLGG
jgi:hypothetical protein